MPLLTARQNNARKNDDVQSVLVSREYDPEDVKDIMDLIGFNYFYVDGPARQDKSGYWRVRQFNPGLLRKNPHYRTVSSKHFYGIKYVIEY